jgi:hypothetical protein
MLEGKNSLTDKKVSYHVDGRILCFVSSYICIFSTHLRQLNKYNGYYRPIKIHSSKFSATSNVSKKVVQTSEVGEMTEPVH